MGPTNTNTLASPSTVAPKKKGIKAIFIVGAILIVVLIVFITILATNNSAQTTPDATSTPVVTVSDLKISFTNLSKALIYDDANFNKAPNFSSNPNNWQITKIANSSNATSQAAYAETLLGLQKVFAASLENYLLQYPDSTLAENGTKLNNEIMALVLYLRFGKFNNDFLAKYLESIDVAQDTIDEELHFALGASDDDSVNLISNIAHYYQKNIQKLQILNDNGCIVDTRINNICVSNLRNGEKALLDFQNLEKFMDSFITNIEGSYKAIISDLPETLKTLNNIIGELNG